MKESWTFVSHNDNTIFGGNFFLCRQKTTRIKNYTGMPSLTFSISFYNRFSWHMLNFNAKPPNIIRYVLPTWMSDDSYLTQPVAEDRTFS